MLPGIAEPAELSKVAPGIEGVLMTLSVEEGDRVQRGQLLATMDNRIAQAAVQYAAAAASRGAAIQRAEAELAAAERLLARIEKVAERAAVTEQEVDAVRVSVETATANLSLANEVRREAAAQLELERARLRAHELLAPFDGVVLQIHAAEGESITREHHVVTIANLDQLRMHLYVPARLYDQLSIGADYFIVASLPKEDRLPVRLVSFEPRIDPATQAFRCVFEYDNRVRRMPAGFSVRLQMWDANLREPPQETAANASP